MMFKYLNSWTFNYMNLQPPNITFFIETEKIPKAKSTKATANTAASQPTVLLTHICQCCLHIAASQLI